MDREIDAAVRQPGVKFLGPQRLAADFGKRTIKHLIAAGDHGDEFDSGLLPAVRGAQPRAGFLGLGHGEW